MSKIRLIAMREILGKIRSRGFLLTTLALPLIFIVIALVGGGVTGGGVEPVEAPPAADQVTQPVGIVDRADLIQKIPSDLRAAPIMEYSSLGEGESALRSGEIGALFLIPEDYRQSGDVVRYSLRLGSGLSDTEWLDWLLVSNLLPDMDQAALQRARYPFNAQNLRVVTLSAQGAQGAAAGSMIPYFVGIAVMMPLFTGGGYLFQSLTEEKSSRMLEILLVSIRPWQLLAGKVLGYAGLILLQYVVWIFLGAVAAAVTGSGGGGGLLASVDLSGPELLWVLPYALGGFLLYAGIMAGIGALAEDMESSRVWIFVITLPMLLPFYLGSAISQSPGGSLAVVLSLIPFSAPVAMMLRLTSTAVPVWQILFSLGALLLTGAGAIFVMARLFRAQVLLGGGGLSIRRLWSALSGSGS
jgi:ABC-2 type transport system permease protein